MDMDMLRDDGFNDMVKEVLLLLVVVLLEYMVVSVGRTGTLVASAKASSSH
jgi:hypothetical protein